MRFCIFPLFAVSFHLLLFPGPTASAQPDWQQFPSPHDNLSLERERFLRDIQWDERAYAQSDSFPVIGRWAWGPCRAVAAKDSVVFIGNGSLFQVLSSPDSGQPAIIAEHLTPGLVVDIATRDSLVFVLASNVIQVLNVSNLPSLTLLAEFTLPFIAPTRIMLHGSYAFILFFNGRFTVVDISIPSSPTMRGTIFATSEDARALQLYDEYAYVGATDSPFLTVVNIQNPDSPFVAANIATGRALNLHIADTLLFVGGLFNYFDLYSIVQPATPQFLSRTNFGTESAAASGFSSLKNHAYIGSSQIYVADISNPLFPQIIDSVSHPQIQQSGRLAISDGRLYNSRLIGLWGLDVSEPQTPLSRWSFVTADQCWRVIHRGNFVYIASGNAGLWILDVSDPSRIRNVGNILTGGVVADIALVGDLAFVVNYPFGPWAYDKRGLWTIDVSDPSSPAILSHHIGIVRSSGNTIPNSIAARDSFVFVTQYDAHSDSAMEIVDVSDPTQPQTRSVYHTNALPLDVVLKDTVAFLATQFSGVQILSVVNPDSPSLIGASLSTAVSLVLQDSLLFANADSGITILNVHDPTVPVFLGAMRFGGVSWSDMTVGGGYLSKAEGAVRVADVRDPIQPLPVAQFGFGGGEYWDAYGVTASRDTLFVVGRGMWMVKNSLVTSVRQWSAQPPVKLNLSQNFPNPFNPLTKIQYEVSARSFVRLSVHNILGERVETLAAGIHSPGKYAVILDCSGLGSGVYFAVLQDEKESVVRKMILIR